MWRAAGPGRFCQKAQLLNYDRHRAIFEAWNARLWHNTSGVLLWMTHPAWPSMIWQVYARNYTTAGAYYGAQTACEPLHVQLHPLTHEIAVINTTLRPVPGAQVRYALYDAAGRELLAGTRPTAAPANQLTPAFPLPLPTGLLPAYLVRLALLDATGQVVADNEYWQRATAEATFQAFNALPAVQLPARLLHHDATRRTLVYELANPGATLAPAVAPNLCNAAGRPVLPAYCSAGYFTLLPHERKTLTVQYPPGSDPTGWQLVATPYNSQ